MNQIADNENPAPVTPSLNVTANTDQIVEKLIAAGKLEAAIEVFTRFECSDDTLMRFTRLMFSNRNRATVAEFLLQRSERLNPNTAAIVLRNIITLAESEGQMAMIKEGLLKIDAFFRHIVSADMPEFADRNRVSAAEAAMNLFLLDHAERIAASVSDEGERSRLCAMLAGYEQCCRLVGVDPSELPYGTRAIMGGDRLRVEQPTVVVRITPRLWDSLRQKEEINATSLPDGFPTAQALRKSGFHVRLAPQFALPGPSLFAPFSREQSHPIAFVDVHKYSKDGPFVHHKSTHNKRVLVDRGGYSGWAEIQAEPSRHPFEERDLSEARSFCEKIRLETFGASPQRPDDFALYGKYAIVPLQMPGDSVQKLSPFPFYEMIDACIEFFTMRGLNVVLRRHPQCKDPELSDYLERLPQNGKVFLSQHRTQDLILHAEAVALCNSSVGWDAILAHRPLICFGLAEYSRVAHQVHEMSDLFEIENLEALVSPSKSDLFFSYFWREYALRGTPAIHARTKTLLRETLGYQ